nr:ABCG transpoter Scarlet1 [Hymenopus coronatus]
MVQKLDQGYGEWNPLREGVTLSWREVSVYTVVKTNQSFFRRSKTIYKRIINNVAGAVRPGSLVAIMGASGAGKSTLMAALAYRSSGGVVVEGDIRVNGRCLGDYMQRLSGFMHQEDLFVSSLTVREHLVFMARLRLDRRTSNRERQRQVNGLLADMGLTAQADILIGSVAQDKVLSGGEKKRLAFATEMLTNPALLFCDEPTTGLDSYSAQKLVEKMKEMANHGRTVLCTIHQPSSELFNMFHQLILVADGRIAFIGEREAAIEFFRKHGYICPEAYNPADFFIRTLAITPGSETASQVAIKRLCDEFAVTDTALEVDVLVRLEYHKGSQYEPTEEFMRRNYKEPCWTSKFICLTYRAMLQVLRDPAVQYVRIVQKIVIALVIGLCYVESISLTQNGIQSVQGALTLFVTENTFTPMYSVLALLPAEMPLFLREHRSGLYTTHMYYFSKMIAMLPGLILEPLIFILVAYWLVGLRNTVYAFSMTAIIATLTMNVSTACGCFFGSAFESASIAMAYLVPFDYVLMITSGLFINLSTLPRYIAWVQYISWLMYSNEALSIVQWNGIHNITCGISDPKINASEIPCMTEGWQVLNQYSFSSDHMSRNIVAMVFLYCTFHLLGFFCLRSRAKNA